MRSISGGGPGVPGEDVDVVRPQDRRRFIAFGD